MVCGWMTARRCVDEPNGSTNNTFSMRKQKGFDLNFQRKDSISISNIDIFSEFYTLIGNYGISNCSPSKTYIDH